MDRCRLGTGAIKKNRNVKKTSNDTLCRELGPSLVVRLLELDVNLGAHQGHGGLFWHNGLLR